MNACLRIKPTRINLPWSSTIYPNRPPPSRNMFHKPNFATTTALSFDIYGTLVDWESGILKDLHGLTSQLAPGHACHPQSPDYHKSTIDVFNKHEHHFTQSHPGALYEDILTETYKALAAEWGLHADPAVASALGDGIERWEAFPDTVAAMQKLGRKYKLIALSNISRSAFAKTVKGPLKDVKWDATYLAENIGSYKPDHNNFKYLLEHAEQELGVKKTDLVHVAHGINVDQVPAEELGIEHVWIRRGTDAASSAALLKGQLTHETLGDLADDLVK